MMTAPLVRQRGAATGPSPRLDLRTRLATQYRPCLNIFKQHSQRLRYSARSNFYQWEQVMGQILVTLFVGLIVGWIARFLLPGRQSLGLIMTSLLGVAGSFAASYAGQFLGLYPAGAPAGWIASVVGAMVLLFIYTRLAKGGN